MFTVIRRHDQWRSSIIILNYADRWKSRVWVPTCDGWLNWTNDSPCSTAHSSVMPIRVWYLVSEGPSSQSAYQCPSPITVQTSVYATHYNDSTANLCGAVFDPDTEVIFLILFLLHCWLCWHGQPRRSCSPLLPRVHSFKYGLCACLLCHPHSLYLHAKSWK